MPLPSSVRCAIFDLDGTLLDTLDDLADAANTTLSEAGYPVHPVADYRYYVGDGARTLIERILPESARTAEEIDRCLARYTHHYGHGWDRKSKPYAGIPELLHGLQQRRIALTVLSNKPHAFTLKCMEALCPGEPEVTWTHLLGMRDGFPAKPDPAGVHEILEMLQVPPSETIYFGDTNTDMKTAVAAGVFPIGVLWGFRPREELLEAGAQLLLSHPAELLSQLPPLQ